MGIFKWAFTAACVAWTASAAIHEPFALMKRQNISVGSPLYNCHDNCGKLPSMNSDFIIGQLTHAQARRSLRSRTAEAARPTSATTPPSPRTTTTACSAPVQTTRTFGSTTALNSTPRPHPVASLRRPSPARKTVLTLPLRQATQPRLVRLPCPARLVLPLGHHLLRLQHRLRYVID